MSKVFFSAMMFAMLCTGNLSPEAVTSGQMKDISSQTIAHYQLFHQNISTDLQDNFDDDDDEEQEVLS